MAEAGTEMKSQSKHLPRYPSFSFIQFQALQQKGEENYRKWKSSPQKAGSSPQHTSVVLQKMRCDGVNNTYIMHADKWDDLKLHS